MKFKNRVRVKISDELMDNVFTKMRWIKYIEDGINDRRRGFDTEEKRKLQLHRADMIRANIGVEFDDENLWKAVTCIQDIHGIYPKFHWDKYLFMEKEDAMYIKMLCPEVIALVRD